MPTPVNGGTRVVIDQAILDQIDEIRPHYMDRTTFINLFVDRSPDGKKHFQENMNQSNRTNVRLADTVGACASIVATTIPFQNGRHHKWKMLNSPPNRRRGG